ncbi:Uncharacterised protein [uncultured archaeon]|nr:Uncharacterised protein [uncultured archaeon]
MSSDGAFKDSQYANSLRAVAGCTLALRPDIAARAFAPSEPPREEVIVSREVKKNGAISFAVIRIRRP